MSKAIVAFAVAFAVLATGQAWADDQGLSYGPSNDGWQWRDYHGVGSSCNLETNSNYVKSVKAILWADGQICCQSYINQTFNSNTDTKVRNYQSDHGLTADGCVGYFTWDNMQNYRHYDIQTDTYKPHLRTDGTFCCGEYYKWREWEPYQWKDRWARYQRYCGGCGGDLGGEHGCWHLLKVKNTSNGNVKTFNHTRVDHDGDGNCD